MMFYDNGHMSGWGWFGMAISMIIFWILLIALVVLVLRAISDHDAATTVSGPARSDPRQILAERYARGDIDEDEYRRRLATLDGGPRHPVAS